MRSVEEPSKDKVFRGSKDGFVETNGSKLINVFIRRSKHTLNKR
jgi:hypothetical protein